MNTNHLKKFAQEARRKLLEQVGAKLAFVLTTDSAELREKTEQVKQLREELNRTTKEQLVEKVAYTWFNRLMALRFMDANDYQPLGIRVMTPKDGYTTPELLDEAKRGNIPEELNLKRQRVYDILDNRIPSTNPQNEAYKELLIAACNQLNTTFSFLFERLSDYSELLLPDDLTSDFSIVTIIREGMPSEDCKNVEIIGWLYQFYISEEKDRLINAKKIYQPNEIAPVTQLFTPKWIVQYMVDNTLGQFWKEARPDTKILKYLEFYIKPRNENTIPKREVKSPEQISFFDPCVGSAHILCYAFDIFYRIYEEEGYTNTEIPELIITKNIFGIDIDERAAQLAGFALMMKGRQYNRRFLNKGLTPNITAFQNIDINSKFKNAQTFGSLIKINQNEVDNIILEENTIFSEQQKHLKKQASFLAKSYDILVTNPPYLNSSHMDGELKQFLEREYKSTKSDLFACFLIQAINLTKNDGFIGYISPYVWMFISSYENLREKIIEATTISSLIQLEYNAFEPACVPIATFTLRNKYFEGYHGSYIKLSEFKGHVNQAPKTIEAIQNPNCGWFYSANQIDFKKITGTPIGYWLKEKFFTIFSNEKSLSEIIEITGSQNITANNVRFLRYHWEVEASKISDIHWATYCKGGTYRKWYGNNELVVNWSQGARDYYSINQTSNLLDKKYWFRKGITWSDITSSKLSFRINDKQIFDKKGPTFFCQPELFNYLISYLNSIIVDYLSSILNPTMSFQVHDLKALPITVENEMIQTVSTLSQLCINISKEEWDSKSCSPNFKMNEFIRIRGNEILTVEEVYDLYVQYWGNKFYQMHKCEEELNRHFININSVQDELIPNVPLEDITILQDEVKRELIKNQNQKLNRDQKTLLVQDYRNISLPFIPKEIITQFIDYSIDCIFGRYSLDKEGLIMADQGATIQDYLNKINKSKCDCTFFPDEDNIIPILDDEWFEDDIVGRFYQFLKVTFGEKNFNKNLAFIEEQIGKDIRKFFIKDFYTENIKRYNKRPIYWMFSSPKGSFNVLIYMHRYTQDTVSNILNKYLKEFIGKLKTRKEVLQHIQVKGSPTEKAKAMKETDNIDKMLIELQEYERDYLFPLAAERISINLDDGVLVNYNKFGKAVKEVTGLNDKVTKKKVKEFDWIDTKQIR